MLGAAYNRSTLLTSADQPTTGPATFYRETVTDHYSRVLHENTVDGRIYGSAVDDVADFALFLPDTAPTRFTLDVTPFA